MITKKKTIGELFTWVKGKKPTHLFDNEKEETIPYLSASYFRTNKPDYYASVNDKNCVLVDKDEVVLIWDGSNAGDVFCGLQGALSSTMVKFNKSEKCLSNFLYYLLVKNFQNLNKRTTGSTIPHVNGSALKEIEIPINSIADQQSVIKILSTVQSAISGQEELIIKLKELKRSMMQFLFTRGTKGEKIKMTEIGEIPESWRVVEFGNFAKFKNGINFSKTQKGNQGIKTIDVFNMYGGNGLDIKLDKLYSVNKKVDSDHLLRKGDILLVRSSLKQEGIGWVCHFSPIDILDYTFCGFIIRARLNSQEFDSEFLSLFLRTGKARQLLISGSGKVAITNINQGMLSKMMVPCPSIEEQNEIKKTIFMIDKKIESAQEKLSIYQNLFKTLLHELISGERRVKL